MATQLILVEDVEHLGKMGDHVSVSEGYARNYLLPRRLATKASPGILRQLEVKKARQAEEMAAKARSAQELAARLNEVSVTIPARATEEENLYGSVGPQQIVEALKEMQYEIEPRQVQLAEPIRTLGNFSVEIKLHGELSATVKVWVVKA